MLNDVFDDAQIALRPTAVHVSRTALQHNLRHLRSIVGSSRKVMAIVKANAYGHGLIDAAKEFLRAGADALGVAFLEEGIALRRAGIRAPILVLGGIIGNQVRHFLEHDLDVTVASPFKLRQVEEAAKQRGIPARIHLAFDTGMQRLGVQWDNSGELLRLAGASDWAQTVGIFSHFATAEDGNRDFAEEQMRRFGCVLEAARRAGLSDFDAHLANTAGILQLGERSFHDMVRPGLGLYGVGPAGPEPSLQAAMRLETRIVYFKVVRAGRTVSYDRTWAPAEDTRLVTLPIGYGDGYSRALSNRAEVLVRGQRCPVVGRVTMDATMVDLGPDGTGYNGDEVVLLGPQGDEEITTHEFARWQQTIPYEVLTGINTRVPRIYVDDFESLSAVQPR